MGPMLWGCLLAMIVWSFVQVRKLHVQLAGEVEPGRAGG